MSKNKKGKFNSKNIVINQEDLAITKIGELEATQQNPFFIFLLFGILLIFIFFLPTIVDWIKGPDEKPDYSITQEEEKKDNHEESEDKKDMYYTFNSELEIGVATKVIVKQFQFNGNILSFHVVNAGDNSFSFATENYFMEFYSEANTLLERILLKDIVIPKQASEKFEFLISNSTIKNVKKIKLISKEIMDYPNIILEKNNNQEEVLICNKEYENLTYIFQNEKLLRMEHALNYTNQVADYSILFSKWKMEAERLNSINGIQSIFANAGNGFAVNTKVDLNIANIENTNQVYYYPLDTLAKVIKFEMEARGFHCK